MKLIARFIEIVNASTKPLILQPKILVCEEDFQLIIPPRHPLSGVSNQAIVDFSPFLNGGLNLEEYIFIWGKARIKLGNLSLRTEGQCYMNYVDINDPQKIKSTK